ncbi:MAG: 23S rRNA (uracil(1939)-C(5))-methyltransferase RlmD [Succiniclasticum sp.]|jgi:23S rRNA (uracil1939-C5)-methyltransferase|nr:23S rRNA (uracil(1939)-C(5))-methyltransferase RlmD [Succiniclasticum sp.]
MDTQEKTRKASARREGQRTRKTTKGTTERERRPRETAGRPPFRKGQEITVTIDNLDSEGRGIGRCEGLAVFVPETLPGEQVKARVELVKKNFLTAQCLRVATASPDRVDPVCPVYRLCGGCQLQHLSYAGELERKTQQVQDALKRIGHLGDVKVLSTLANVQPLYYRNKMQVPVAGGKDSPRIGCFAKGTHRVIDVEDCCIQRRENNRIAAVARQWMTRYHIPAYDEDRRTGLVRHIMGRVGVHTGEIMVCLVTAEERVPHRKELVQMLQAAIPGLTSVVQNVNKRSTNVILGEKTYLVYGKETIQDKIGNLTFHISAQSFFQVNSEQVEVLYNKALEFADLRGTETVVDLYCGTGTITLFLAQKARLAVGIEIVPSAIRDAKKNARANHLANAEFLLGDAAVEMPRLVKDGLRPDVVVVDPPRAGCEARVLDAIARVRPEKVVYVSCNPATLARDLAYLKERGFAIAKVQPVDMFSRTHHVETVVLMSKVGVEYA